MEVKEELDYFCRLYPLSDVIEGGYVGIDFDGTLSEFEFYEAADVFGNPVQRMIEFVRGLLALGYEVRVFTARVCEDTILYELSRGRTWVSRGYLINEIKLWCKENIGVELEVTDVKSFLMFCYIDDLAIRCERNTGVLLI